MSSITKICKIKGCNRINYGKGYCKSHRRRLLIYDNATTIKMPLERHGLYFEYIKEHGIWSDMKRRCYDPRRPYYKNYGGRGIKVCDRWLHSFKNFLDDMGPRPSSYHSLERKDVNKGYNPNNCKWATSAEQSSNRTDTHFITINGETKAIYQWCREYNIPRTTFHNRLKRGWSGEQLIENKRYTIQ